MLLDDIAGLNRDYMRLLHSMAQTVGAKPVQTLFGITASSYEDIRSMSLAAITAITDGMPMLLRPATSLCRIALGDRRRKGSGAPAPFRDLTRRHLVLIYAGCQRTAEPADVSVMFGLSPAEADVFGRLPIADVLALANGGVMTLRPRAALVDLVKPSRFSLEVRQHGALATTVFLERTASDWGT